MQNVAIKSIKTLLETSNFIFYPIDSFIEKIQMADWIKDALIDSLHMLPFLFIIFLVIEFIEYFFADKMTSLIKQSDKGGPLVGSILASFPQCGFSVVASTLYTKKIVNIGTLIAVYLSTSDEAIPVILAAPGNAHIVIKLVLVKIFIAIVAGYLINFTLASVKKTEPIHTESNEPEGCCKHQLKTPHKKELILHPIVHTLNVFFFIFIVTLAINYLVMLAGGEENLGKYFLSNSVFQPLLTAIFGLIPNCAASVAITLMYLKGAIGFGSVIAGLCSSAGLGLLVLLRKNDDIKDTMKITGLLLLISTMAGIIIQALYN